MFISGMITHGAFMLTLDLLFSFVLSSVCFDYFLFSLYSTVSYFPYYEKCAEYSEKIFGMWFRISVHFIAKE